MEENEPGYNPQNLNPAHTPDQAYTKTLNNMQ